MEDALVTMPNGSKIAWRKHPDVHWCIIGGQHTLTACCEFVEQFLANSKARKDPLEFEVISVLSRDQQVLVKVSNSLNLNIAEKVEKETLCSCAELGRAAWKRAGCPESHKGGHKPSAAFNVIHFA